MLHALEVAVQWGVGALGVLSLGVLAAAAAYMLRGLWQRRRTLSLALVVSALGFALSPPGAWIVCAGCALVVGAQSICYAWFAVRTLLSRPSPARWRGPLPSVTVIVPAKDEELVIEDTLRAIGGLDYPRQLLEVVVIDDGSTDTTLDRARAIARSLPQQVGVVQFATSGGKARRLNEVLRTLTTDFVLILDADHWIARDFIRRVLDPFGAGPGIACVQVASEVRNADTNLLTRALDLEYLFRCRGIYPGKPIGVFVGSGGMFRRSALLESGGFDPQMLTEDVELTYRLYRHGYRVVYADSTSSRDLAPVDFRNFFNQRHRWMRGLFQALALHVRPAGAHPLFGKALPYLVQFTLDGFGVLCLCVLQAYFALHQLGVVTFRFTPVIVGLFLSSTFGFIVALGRARRLGHLRDLVIFPLYMVAHTIPMAWALIDGYLLGKPIVWVKTERGAPAASTAGLSGGRA